jgi:N-acetylglucosaminyldiphosphoundecaprenol N-acetyl-beta-D-mannosaminyltransferase
MSNDVLSGPDGSIKRSELPASSSRWRVLGLPVDRVNMDGATQTLAAMIERARRERREGHLEASWPQLRQVVTLNPEMVMAAQRDDALRSIIQRAALVVPDGVGVVWASRLLGGGLVERVAGVDLFERLAPLAEERGYRLFLLGGRPGIAREAARRLRAQSPGLTIVGAHSGSADGREAGKILTAIRDADTELLCVAFGSPIQERWIAEYGQQLGAVVAIGVGGALDFIAGAVKRAPRWMRATGLEWLYRLMRQPWRWRRMLALPRFVVAILLEWAHARSRREVRVGA